VGEGDLWARIDEDCRPALVDDTAASRIEITTCVQDDVTCGVTITATGEATLDRAWCRRDRDLLIGPVGAETLRLVEATEDHAHYVRIVELVVERVCERTELQACTPKSLRELKRQDLPPWLRPDEQGNRRCTFVDGFEVAERPYGADPVGSVVGGVKGGSAGARPEPSTPATAPPLVDCTQPCSSPSSDEQYVAHAATVGSRPYLPPQPRGIDLFRTPAACAAAQAPPSILPADLCTTLGARLR